MLVATFDGGATDGTDGAGTVSAVADGSTPLRTLRSVGGDEGARRRSRMSDGRHAGIPRVCLARATLDAWQLFSFAIA